MTHPSRLPGASSSQAETVDWGAIIAQQNAKVAKVPGAVVPSSAPAPQAASLMDEAVARQNASLAGRPGVVIPGAGR